MALVVGFVGLPCAGKSTIINALAGKRVLESGVCRTTTEACLVGSLNIVGAPKWVETDLVSDDGVEFATKQGRAPNVWVGNEGCC